MKLTQPGNYANYAPYRLTKEDLEGRCVPLKFVRFQNVGNVVFFIVDNQTGTNVTRVNRLQLIGTPVATTNMTDFKRITGKKGEAH